MPPRGEPDDAGLFGNDWKPTLEPVRQDRDPDGLGYVMVELREESG